MTHRVYTKDVVYEGDVSPLDVICAREKSAFRRKYYLHIHSAAAVHVEAAELLSHEQDDLLLFNLSMGCLKFDHMLVGAKAIDMFLNDALHLRADPASEFEGLRTRRTELLVGHDVFAVFEDKSLYGFLRPDGAELAEIGDLETYIKTRQAFQHNKVIHAAAELKKKPVILGPKGEVLNL